MNDRASQLSPALPVFPFFEPSELRTFDPLSKSSAQELIPVGMVEDDNGGQRFVGVPRGGPLEPVWSLVVGASGAGKTQLITSQMLAVAQAGEGFLYFNPDRSGFGQLKEHLGNHADRVFELTTDALGAEGPATVGWNPLDVTVVPDSERASYVAMLNTALPRALFPRLCGPEIDALQTRTLIFRSLECLVNLNLALPPEMQANIFCIEKLLTDEDWRNEAISELPARLRKWWLADFPNIIGDKGSHALALRHTLNTLQAMESNERIFAMLGASLSTIRWREIMNNGGIVLMSPYTGEPEASKPDHQADVSRDIHRLQGSVS